jgi:hypothetical protein
MMNPFHNQTVYTDMLRRRLVILTLPALTFALFIWGSTLVLAQTPPEPTPASILSEIDLSALPSPLTLDSPILATMPAEDEAAFTFTFAGADVPVFLGLARLNGNANLAVVVLDSENTPLFQASMLSAETLIAGLTLPQGNTYSILIFSSMRDDLESLEPTDFQLQITRAD